MISMDLPVFLLPPEPELSPELRQPAVSSTAAPAATAARAQESRRIVTPIRNPVVGKVNRRSSIQSGRPDATKGVSFGDCRRDDMARWPGAAGDPVLFSNQRALGDSRWGSAEDQWIDER